MISILYDIFKKWSAKGSVYIISDPHFNDAESFEFRTASGKLPENITTVKALADYQVKCINDVCHKNDTLICLGDVGDIEYVKKLKAGYKVLILGNHDRGADYYKREILTVIRCPECGCTKLIDLGDNDGMSLYKTQCSKCHFVGFTFGNDFYAKDDNRLFDEVYSGPLMISDKILLSHEPIIPCPDCIVNLCGHVHANGHKFKVDGHKYYNFCAEAIDYKPVSLGELIKKGLLSKVKDIHEVTVAGAVERKKRRTRD